MVGVLSVFFFFQAEDGIRDGRVTGVQTCALPISLGRSLSRGETVSIESHWGGLGGGIGGWRLSTPLIYLLGIVFILIVSCALAWRVFPPRGVDAQTQPTPMPPSGSTN